MCATETSFVDGGGPVCAAVWARGDTAQLPEASTTIRQLLGVRRRCRRACIAGLKSLACGHSDPASHSPSSVLSCVVAGRWHGSEWCNWHSILRNGAWFATQHERDCTERPVCALSSLRPPLFPSLLALVVGRPEEHVKFQVHDHWCSLWCRVSVRAYARESSFA